MMQRAEEEVMNRTAIPVERAVRQRAGHASPKA
jgi:hypothetical protein